MSLASYTRLIGIVNLTPDSFSGGQAHLTQTQLFAYITSLAISGAGVIDIGAESTRPNAKPISAAEEWLRLSPYLGPIKRLLADLKVELSVDTRHGETARRALDVGADWINDVSGLSDPSMLGAVKDSDCKLVLMHALSVPADPQMTLPKGKNPVPMVLSWAQARLEALESEGIARERIVFDPGVGFGKTAAQSLQLIRQISRFGALGVPLLVGHSRKSFLSLFSESTATERDVATLEVSRFLVKEGVEFLRVHDIALHNELISSLSLAA